MRRLWIMLLVGLLAAAVAAPAAAKRPPLPTPPEHPPGMSCAEAVIYYGATHQVIAWAPDTDGDRVQVSLTRAEPQVCIDVLNAAAGSFTIQVTDPGAARTLSANLRDSHPGDFCGGCNSTSIDLRTTDTLTFAGMAAATVNACGVEYSEGVLDEDGNLVDQTFTQTGEADPLALSIWESPTRATVQLTVTFHAG
ncbi:MAG: hypothetical protein JW785_05295 [Acidimicrobiia bacterium]|nr:hypothetical protein [Acidimicrobiia bacterium]